MVDDYDYKQHISKRSAIPEMWIDSGVTGRLLPYLIIMDGAMHSNHVGVKYSAVRSGTA